MSPCSYDPHMPAMCQNGVQLDSDAAIVWNVTAAQIRRDGLRRDPTRIGTVEIYMGVLAHQDPEAANACRLLRLRGGRPSRLRRGLRAGSEARMPDASPARQVYEPIPHIVVSGLRCWRRITVVFVAIALRLTSPC